MSCTALPNGTSALRGKKQLHFKKVSTIRSGNISADLQDFCVVPVSSNYISLCVEAKIIISWPAMIRKKTLKFEDTSRYGALALVLGEKDCNKAIRDAY